MATVARVTLTCDLCDDTEDVTTWTFGLDGKAYEIDLCRKDGTALDRVAARYIAQARKVSARPGHRPARRQRSGSPRVRRAAAASGDGARAPGTKASGRGRATGSPREKAETSRSGQQAAAAAGVKAEGAGSKKAARASRLHGADGTSAQAAGAVGVRRHKGICVYGILPGDIEMTEDTPGVGKHPGPLRDVRLDGLAALISDVDMSARLGSPEDLRTYREILDATAAEVPVVPLRFGTILASEDAVAEELLAARHEEFAAVLERLEGRAEFQVKGRYIEDAVLEKVVSQNKRAAQLRDAVQGKNPDVARTARIELGQLMNEAVTAWREQDTPAVRRAMKGVCVASVARKPARELDAVNVAFLVDAGAEHEVERVIECLAREWEGRIDLQLLGPMAAYDFTRTAQPEC
jgi:Gas vesicle synthesis protein GvpL/GvpF/Lsr2